ncbi:AAA family ATPase [Roseateles cellulosilyticus]|uniref:MoxR family ATPase n=1 Tax=Pelomonas cellulosilytica TaxID=2906762 RepID=A0ABS8XSI2_9BURK|nr:MoxR family ATPase [Pelomonas sp. P8]MCE4554662.1 MoxR family ATPase [Pelomonas sp. P8]
MTPGYTPLFSPATPQPAPQDDTAIGDRSALGTYVFSDEITLAVNVALATGRPLLVRGTSGAGKTSLARALAPLLGCDFRETVVTGRTQAQDLLWTVDLLRRLQDAQLNQLSTDWSRYVVPGPLWWAFDAASARAQQGVAEGTAPETGAGEPRRSLLLIDEIDKADPDVPNSLLRPLGDLAFDVTETRQRVEARRPTPVIIITTNEERDLPPAFLRRCVELTLPRFDRARLLAIGRAHFPQMAPALADAAAELALAAAEQGDRRDANPAEYLDLLRACQDLAVTPASAEFRQLANVVLG